MPSIGIVDDRKEQREEIRSVFESCFEDDKWVCIDTTPFIQMDEYPSWIVENEISIIVLDERLHEEEAGNGIHVNYNGHNLAEYLRQGNPTLPIYVVTSYSSDDGLVNKKNIVENIISREDFGGANADMYVQRMLRSGMHYSKMFLEELSEISRLANKIATGDADENDLKELRAKQTSIKLAFPVNLLVDREQWISRFEEELNVFEKLKVEVTEYLKDPK